MHLDLTSYAYVGNNPLRYNDPLGLDTVPTSVNDGKMVIPKNPGADEVLKVDNGDGSSSYYNYDPNNPNANSQGYVGGGTESTEEGVTVSGKRKSSSSSAGLPWWLDPSMAGAGYQVGKALDTYRLDGYGQGRPWLPGAAQTVFDRNFPKGSFGNSRPVNIHIPGTGRSIEAPRYIVSSTGKILKFAGVLSAGYGVYSTEQQYANGDMSNVHRWTNHAMTVVGFMGPGGVVVSLVYSVVVEDMIFGKGSSWASEYNDKIFPAF